MGEGLSLVKFLADLRSDLMLARQRAVEDAVEKHAAGQAQLWFDVGEVAVTIEVAHTSTVSTEASAEVEAKFWVFASAKAGAKIGGQSSQTGIQTLTLTMKPQYLELVAGENGTPVEVWRSAKIEGRLDPREQLPQMVPPPTGTAQANPASD